MIKLLLFVKTMSTSSLVKVTYDQKKAFVKIRKLYKSLPPTERKPLSLDFIKNKIPPKDYFVLVSTLGTIGESDSKKAKVFSQFVDFGDKQPAEAVEQGLYLALVARSAADQGHAGL